MTATRKFNEFTLLGDIADGDVLLGERTNGTTVRVTYRTSGGTGITDGDKGDISVSGNGAVWTIDDAVISYAKMQNVSATDKLLGRSTAGAGSVEEITCTAAGRALLDDIDAAAQRTTLGLGTLATQNGTFSGSSSGTNTGDQSSIVGISGTKAEFDTACSDGNFLYSGDVTQYTDEMAQDAVGAMIDTSLNYVDATPLLQRAALTGDVTASAGSNATTIADKAVTLAKQADVATSTVFYRKTAGTGSPEVQTLSTLKTDLGLTGTNSGDQTSLSGISDTKANFNTACSDGNFVYQGDALGTPSSGTLTNCTGLPYTEVTKPATAFYAYNSADQTISTGTATKCTLNSELYDSGNLFDSTTNYRYTPNVAGIYTVVGGVMFQGMTAGVYTISQIKKNGSVALENDVFAAGTGTSSNIVLGMINMNGTTDYLEFFIYQSAGSNKSTFHGAPYTFFQGVLTERT